MKLSVKAISDGIKTAFSKAGKWVTDYPVAYTLSLYERGKADPKEKNRILIIALSLLFIFDYCMFCLHIEKNIFDIFPSIPLLDDRTTVTLFLPSLDGVTLLKEKRDIPVYESDERKVKYLFNAVVAGSVYENTSFTVPVILRLRKIWIFGETKGASPGGSECVIDIDSDMVLNKDILIKGSEPLFRKALEKTITSIVPSIKRVIVIEKGVPDKALWEL